ncbi:MAG: efflux transporter periplasmic adaptor subunit [Fluviicola sp.]|nr:MAG: efflux transporter periplasmic adaptor subunit [Fluviicola sp.]
MRKIMLVLLGSVFLVACNEASDHEHSEEDSGHDHGQETDLSVDTTIWTNKLELFVEYPALVVGNTSRFAAHFTELADHQPIKKGSVTVSLVKGNKGIRHTVESPSSPGIFTPALQPSQAGTYNLIFEVNTPDLKERIDAGIVQVYESTEAAEHSLVNQSNTEPEISFLKEQAWKIDFQTTPVKRDTIYGVLELSGKWMSTPGTQRTLNAGSSGNVLYETPDMVEGIAVRKGQVLMRISGENMNVGSIETEIRKAKAEFEQAKSTYNRKKELYELEVVPAAEFEEVEKRYEVAQANYQQMLKNYGANGVVIRAPFNGYIKHISVENGDFANAGQPLVIIGSELNNMIKATAPPEKSNLIAQTKKIWLMENGKTLSEKGKVISIGRTVTEDNPLLPVFIEVSAPINVVEGSLAEVHIAYTSGEKGMVIPKTALLENFGAYKVIVQTGGESFEMRPVKIGVFNGDYVNVIQGLKEGEMVVSKGVYQVKMASMAGSAPAHGHAH